MHHRLLVAGLVVGHQVGLLEVVLLQRLPETGDVPVAEDAEHAGHGALADVAVDRPLPREELDQRLADRHPSGLHQSSPSAR